MGDPRRRLATPRASRSATSPRRSRLLTSSISWRSLSPTLLPLTSRRLVSQSTPCRTSTSGRLRCSRDPSLTSPSTWECTERALERAPSLQTLPQERLLTDPRDTSLQYKTLFKISTILYHAYGCNV